MPFGGGINVLREAQAAAFGDDFPRRKNELFRDRPFDRHPAIFVHFGHFALGSGLRMGFRFLLLQGGRMGLCPALGLKRLELTQRFLRGSAAGAVRRG